MTRKKIEITCAGCGNLAEREVRLVNQNIKHNYKIFCSKECSNNYKTTLMTLSCGNCSKETKRTKAEYEKSKSGDVYCSRSCATSMNNKRYKSGENNPNYESGQGSYRKRAIAHYGAKCEVCDYNVELVLQVHHLDHNRDNNEVENLIVLCPTHHVEHHAGLREFRQ